MSLAGNWLVRFHRVYLAVSNVVGCVQAGSVVLSGEYPAGSILAGNPAQIIASKK